jgi:hypothetical protein
VTCDISRFKRGVGASAQPVANGVLGGWCGGVVRTDGAGVRGVRAVGSAVGAGCVGGSRVKGVGTNLHDGFDVGPRAGRGSPHVVVVTGEAEAL